MSSLPIFSLLDPRGQLGLVDDIATGCKPEDLHQRRCCWSVKEHTVLLAVVASLHNSGTVLRSYDLYSRDKPYDLLQEDCNSLIE